jgi:hypothetical protein
VTTWALTTGPVSWRNQAHNLVSLILYADMMLAQFVLAAASGRGARTRRPATH